MKKIMTTVTVLSSATVVNAGNGFNDQVFSVCAGIFILLAILTFIINFLQKILDHRLKNRILIREYRKILSPACFSQNMAKKKI